MLTCADARQTILKSTHDIFVAKVLFILVFDIYTLSFRYIILKDMSSANY